MKYYSNPLSVTSQFYHCSVPFRLDTYRGCYYDCAYCFATELNHKSGFTSIMPADYKVIKSLLDRALSKGKKSTNVAVQMLRRRVPIHFGGLSDPFQPIEKSYSITLKTMSLLLKYDYPTIFSTKSALIIEEPYFRVLKQMRNKAVQISLITSDDKIRMKFEPKANTVSERLEIIRELASSGIWASCRIQPLIPFVNNADMELIDSLADVGCKHVIIEHYKLPSFLSKKSEERLDSLCDYKIGQYYRRRRKKNRSAFWELQPTEKADNLRELVKHIRKRKMTFGAADNDLHDLGDSCCCCGVDGLTGFANVYLHHNAKAVTYGKINKSITYSSIEHEWCSDGSVREIVNYECR